MTEPLADTWTARDLPVLRAVVETLEAGSGSIPSADKIAAATGLTTEDVNRAARNLERAGLVELLGTWGGPSHFNNFHGRAPELVGMWPTPETALDRMIAALEAIAENTDDEDTRTRARKILDGLTGASKTIGLSVAAAAITGQLPGQ